MSSRRVRLATPVKGARLLERESDTLTSLLRAERERAHARGVAEGRALERAETAQVVDRTVEAVQRDREQAAEDLTRGAVALGTAIARALLKKEIEAGNYDLEAMVRETLSQGTDGRGTCRVHLNPGDCARLEGVPFRTGTILAPDEDVAPGDVHVETALGLLVRETRAALVEIERALLEDVT